MRTIIKKLHQNLLELQEELLRPDNSQKYTVLATICPVGNNHLPEKWAYTPRVLKLVSLDVSYHKEHEYIWFKEGELNGF